MNTFDFYRESTAFVFSAMPVSANGLGNVHGFSRCQIRRPRPKEKIPVLPVAVRP